jgi:hypothetical protein
MQYEAKYDFQTGINKHVEREVRGPPVEEHSHIVIRIII